MAVASGKSLAVFPDHVIFGNAPHFCRALLEYADRVPGGKNRRHARREGAAATFGHVVVA